MKKAVPRSSLVANSIVRNLGDILVRASTKPPMQQREGSIADVEDRAVKPART